MDDKDGIKKYFDMLQERSSVRVFIKNKPIPVEDIHQIIESAQRSSTSSNLQTYAFISIEDAEKRKHIAELSGNQMFICDAGVFLVVCVDLHKMDIIAEMAGYKYSQSQYLESFLMAAVDSAIAGQTAAMAAEMLGYGICMIGGIRNNMDRIIDIIGLPKKVFPIFGLCIGHIQQKNKPKSRIPMSGILFKDTYDDLKVRNAIKEYDRLMFKNAYYTGRELPMDDIEIITPKTGADGYYSWIEHSARRICTNNPEKSRYKLKAILEKHGISFK